MSSSVISGKMPIISFRITTTILIFIIIISTVINVPAYSADALCGQVCFCRRETPTSSVSMNCSSVVKLPQDHLSAVNVTSAVSDLDISNNSLTSLSRSFFQGFVGLKTLIAARNRLSVIEAAVFVGTQLQRLDLASNQLAALRSASFSGIEGCLLELDLSYNLISNVDEAFVDLQALSRLDLRHNRLSSLTARSLSGLVSLRHLRLDGNQISEVDHLALDDLSKLTNIALRANPLTLEMGLKFAANSSLSYVDLSECWLSEVPRGIPDTVSYVQLRRNRISRLQGDSFRGATSVRILVLDENQISSVSNLTFRAMTDVQQLWLNNNRLAAVPKGLPGSLQRLMLDSNNIRGLSSDAFRRLAKLQTITLMGNAIAEIPAATFRSQTELNLLDLSANQIKWLPAGLFATNGKLRTLMLSRNPLQSLGSDCFRGLERLNSLSLSFVQTKICVDNNAFRGLTRLRSLEIDNSPWLAAEFVRSPDLLGSLSNLRHLSLQRTDLARLQSAVFSTSLQRVESVRVSGSGWICDEGLLWLRDWLMTSPVADERDRDANRCAEPASLTRRRVVSLADRDVSGLPPVQRKEYLTTGNDETRRRQDCDEQLLSAPAAMTTDPTPTPTTSRDRENTTASASQLRHDDVTEDDLVQVLLIVCTLSVTVILSVIIISVIVRLVGFRRRDVTSGMNSGERTESRINMSHCRPEPEGWRSRASSINRGCRYVDVEVGRTADYHRHTGCRVPACSDVTGRLVNEEEVECRLSNGVGSRMTGDEQWRLYTWEDT